MNSYDNLKIISNFVPYEGEACFPPTVTREYAGGMHIAPECMTVLDNKFIMVDWPDGLPRHESEHTIRFPHGLMRFGETIDEAVERLVLNQMGLRVLEVVVLKIDSYLDDENHWHFEPIVFARVTGEPALPKGAAGFVTFGCNGLPSKSVWGRKSFAHMAKTRIKQFVPNIEA